MEDIIVATITTITTGTTVVIIATATLAMEMVEELSTVEVDSVASAALLSASFAAEDPKTKVMDIKKTVVKLQRLSSSRPTTLHQTKDTEDNQTNTHQIKDMVDNHNQIKDMADNQINSHHKTKVMEDNLNQVCIHHQLETTGATDRI